MDFFKELDERAMTVTVGGKAVALGIPTTDDRTACFKRLMDAGNNDDVVGAIEWDGIVGMALAATVTNLGNTTAEQWEQRVIKDRQDPNPEFAELQEAALRLVGLNAAPVKDARNTQDNVDDADKALGNLPPSE